MNWIVGFIAIVLAIFLELLKLGEGIQILLMYTLVLITWKYTQATYEQAEASKKMVDEMPEQGHAAVRPLIDIIEGESSAREQIRRAVYATAGKLPSGITYLLKNIGLGPAIDVYSSIEDLDGGAVQYCFGTIATSEKTGEMRLFLDQRGDRGVLVVNYQDVYGRRWESSREVSVDKEKGASFLKIGPLRTCKLAKKEPT